MIRLLALRASKRWSSISAATLTRYKSTAARSSTPPTATVQPSRPPPQLRDSLIASYVRPLLKGVSWASAIFLTGHVWIVYVMDYGLCDGISMLPTFNSFGDAVLISKYYRRGRGIKVGDVVSYTHPIEPQIRGLKRVIGMEGDFVLRDTPGVGVELGEESMIQVCLGSTRVM